MKNEKIAIVWLRRDLRVYDNMALEAAVASGMRLLPVFVFDTEILEKLPSKEDRRLEFILRNLRRVEKELREKDLGKRVFEVSKQLPILHFYGKPIEAFEWILAGVSGHSWWKELSGKDNLEEMGEIGGLYFNEDYESYAVKRDYEIERMFKERGINVYKFNDQMVFSPDDSRIRKPDGNPYTIYTPFAKRWRFAYGEADGGMEKTLGSMDFRDVKLEGARVASADDCKRDGKARLLYDSSSLIIFGSTPTAEQIGFRTIHNLGFENDPQKVLVSLKMVLPGYHTTRDFPAIDNGTTKIGIHLRFGTISIREAVAIGNKLNDTWLGELIWREFFMQIIKHFPYSEDAPFKKQYNFIPWRNDQREIEAWMRGETGYPIVDAGMRELNETGHIHNRVRMVVASFLTKHLLTDWRIGESYFASKLNDYELSSNVGNWQWAAGTGCDAAPYFRIFNPTEQARKYDPQGDYIRKWVPEAFEDKKTITSYTIALSKSYLLPIVEHKFARERALTAYALSKAAL